MAQTAADYPNKPVRIIFPFAPGGGAAGTMRIFAEKLTHDMGRPFIIESQPGGNSAIATQALARSDPDGYTLLVTTPTIAINHWARLNLSYDTLNDLVGVSTLIRNHHMIVVTKSVPANTLGELIAYTRENPGKIKAASHPNTNGYLGTRLFMKATGAQLTIISDGEGGAATNAALLSGRVQLSLNTPSNYLAPVRAGRLKGIAISGEQRNPALPDVPTFAEAGLESFSSSNWYILFAPAATPRDIVEKLNVYVGRALASEGVQELLANEGVVPFSNSVAATNAFFRSEVERFGEVIKQGSV